MKPTGIYNSLTDWLDAKIEPYFEKCSYKEIYPIYHFSKPIQNPPTPYPDYLSGGYVAEMPNARVTGYNGSVISPDNQLIWDLSIEWRAPGFGHTIFQKDLPPVSHYFQKAADLTHIGSRNYYHWMYEVIPRIDLLRRSGIEVDRYIVSYEPEQVPFQTETLAHFGLTGEKLVRTYNDFHAQVDNLVIPSQCNFLTHWSYDFLRESFLTEDDLKKSAKKRIYITRKGIRRILNEDELMEVLKKYGFKRVELETLTVAEQARLFASAEVVIGGHGAGLTNLTFCRPGTKVLEIFPPTYITCLYWLISAFGSLEYYHFIGDYGGRDEFWANETWEGYDNLTVDLKKLYPLLKKLKL